MNLRTSNKTMLSIIKSIILEELDLIDQQTEEQVEVDSMSIEQIARTIEDKVETEIDSDNNQGPSQ
jgi:translation elongation factor P/translation initiation factor 5A